MLALLEKNASDPRIVLNGEAAGANRSFGVFGETTPTTGGPGVRNPVLYGWTGREYDFETGLNCHRARCYNANVGRWLSMDPIGEKSGDLNSYRYVFNAPTVYTDSSGLKTDLICRPVQDQIAEMAGAAHCFLRVTSEPNSTSLHGTFVLSLMTVPDPKNPSVDMGRRFLNHPSDVQAGNGTFMVPVTGRAGSGMSQDAIDRAIMDSFERQPVEQSYGVFNNNSNSFVNRVLKDAGGVQSPKRPPGAFGW